MTLITAKVFYLNGCVDPRFFTHDFMTPRWTPPHWTLRAEPSHLFQYTPKFNKIKNKIKNDKILEDLNQVILSERIAERQIKYAGHVYRMPEDRGARLALTASYPEQAEKFVITNRVSWRKQVLGQLQGKSDEYVKEFFKRPSEK